MAYGDVLSPLADPTRRHILEALLEEPMTVGELAAGQPVSRPAVSQHLKVLGAAKLVRAEPRGTRRLYRVRQDELEELRRYLDRFWADAMSAFGAEIARRMEDQ